jgi:hypothetical protein
MTVPRPDTGDKLIERILAVPWAQHNAAIAGEKARQLVAFGEQRLSDNRLRNLHRQTFSPTAHARVIRHMDIH